MLEVPETYWAAKVKRLRWLRCPSRRSRKADGELEDVEPLLAQATAAMLSEAHQMVGCGRSLMSAAICADSTIAASSNSLLLMVPDGLLTDTMRRWIVVGNG
jgi:hypothetical protein